MSSDHFLFIPMLCLSLSHHHQGKNNLHHFRICIQIPCKIWLDACNKQALKLCLLLRNEILHIQMHDMDISAWTGPWNMNDAFTWNTFNGNFQNQLALYIIFSSQCTSVMLLWRLYLSHLYGAIQLVLQVHKNPSLLVLNWLYIIKLIILHGCIIYLGFSKQNPVR